MSKRKNQDFEMDDEFWAQLDFLRTDYDHAIQTIEQQKQDIRKLLSLLVERAIPIPDEMIDKYIKRESADDSDEPEELPFD